MVKIRRSRQPTNFRLDLSEEKAKAIVAGKLNVPKIRSHGLRHERTLARSSTQLINGRKDFIPYESDEEKKKKRDGLVKSLKDNQRRLSKLLAMRDPPLRKETDADLNRRIKIGKLRGIINVQITKLEVLQSEFEDRQRVNKNRRERLAATMNEELIRLEKNKLVPKRSFLDTKRKSIRCLDLLTWLRERKEKTIKFS